METITLSVKDADSMLSYFRYELEEEFKHYEEAQKLCKENKDNPLAPVLTAIADKGHEHNVELLEKFIYLLTNGSQGNGEKEG